MLFKKHYLVVDARLSLVTFQHDTLRHDIRRACMYFLRRSVIVGNYDIGPCHHNITP